jgi:hypothetical protein
MQALFSSSRLGVKAFGSSKVRMQACAYTPLKSEFMAPSIRKHRCKAGPEGGEKETEQVVTEVVSGGEFSSFLLMDNIDWPSCCCSMLSFISLHNLTLFKLVIQASSTDDETRKLSELRRQQQQTQLQPSSGGPGGLVQVTQGAGCTCSTS